MQTMRYPTCKQLQNNSCSSNKAIRNCRTAAISALSSSLLEISISAFKLVCLFFVTNGVGIHSNAECFGPGCSGRRLFAAIFIEFVGIFRPSCGYQPHARFVPVSSGFELEQQGRIARDMQLCSSLLSQYSSRRPPQVALHGCYYQSAAELK